jgi:hypothetical protein
VSCIYCHVAGCAFCFIVKAMLGAVTAQAATVLAEMALSEPAIPVAKVRRG